jgi:hypothetical protein
MNTLMWEAHRRKKADTLMATWESEQWMERRRRQKYVERLYADPEIIALRRELGARLRYEARHPWRWFPHLLRMYCIGIGINEGGRPPQARRCTKRLGSRRCWNWRASGTDRCYRHGRQQH